MYLEHGQYCFSVLKVTSDDDFSNHELLHKNRFIVFVKCEMNVKGL